MYSNPVSASNPSVSHQNQGTLSSKSKCALIALAIGGVAGGAIVGLGALTIFGAVGSIGFIAAMIGGGTLIFVAVGGIGFIAICSYKQSTDETTSANDPIDDTAGQSKNVETLWWKTMNIEEGIKKIDKEFAKDPRTGFMIFWDKTGVSTEGHGGSLRKGCELSGVPDKHPPDCNFCAPRRVPSVADYENCRLIASLSNTPLLIPNKEPIPIHWFQADLQTKKMLLMEAQKVMSKLEEKLPGSEFGLEMHCGSDGMQTVWHLHLRIHRKDGWGGIDWKPYFKN
jgi:diadenosine tetraphosphate (Ap4A) HIT family hydrolase